MQLFDPTLSVPPTVFQAEVAEAGETAMEAAEPGDDEQTQLEQPQGPMEVTII